MGHLYGRIRNPDRLLAMFAALRENWRGVRPLELHFYGDSSECDAEFARHASLVGTAVFRHGKVSRHEAAAATQRADVLINLGNTTTYQLPSKLVEYVASGRPILNVTSIDNDSSGEVLSRYPSCLSINLHSLPPTDAAARVLRFIDETPRQLPAEMLDSICGPYRLDSIADRYLELVERVRSNPAGHRQAWADTASVRTCDAPARPNVNSSRS